MRLAIVTLGHVHAEDLAPLTTRFEHLEQLVLDIPPRDELNRHRAELNRAIDAASADWILIVREREMIDEPLAAEIFQATAAGIAWGFRIRSVVMYGGKPLRIAHDDRELRLFHRRHLLRRGELAVQGTVVRMKSELHSMSFASAAEHRDHLARNAASHSTFRRVLLFSRYLLATRTLDRNTLKYLWIEAGYDVTIKP